MLEIAFILISFLQLSISRLAIKRFFKYTLPAENLFYFLLLTKIFTSPLQVGFVALFIKSEAYEFYFLHNLIISLLILFLYLYSNLILYKKLYPIVVACFINFVVLNVSAIGIYHLDADKFPLIFKNPMVTDVILTEYEEKLAPLADEFPEGKYLVQVQGRNTIIYSFKPVAIDSVAIDSVGDDLGNELSKNYDFQIKFLKSYQANTLKRDSLKYNRNKQLFDTLTYYRNILRSDISNPLDTNYTYIKGKRIICIEGSKEPYGKISSLTMNLRLFESHNSYQRTLLALLNDTDFASYPSYLLVPLLFPAELYYYYFIEEFTL